MKLIKQNPYKSILVIFIGLILFITLTFLYYNSMLRHQYEPVDINDKSIIDITVLEQSSARDIAKLLYEHDLIHSEKVFLDYCKQTKYDSILKVGHYQFSRSQPLMEIAEAIAKGRIVTINFTIPEGYTVEQIGNYLTDAGVCTVEDWNYAVNLKYEFDFLKYDNNNIKEPLEGFLFPDTYKIPENMDAQAIITMMLNNFVYIWRGNFAPQAEAAGKDIYDTITIAAMIEKEAMVAEERTVIAGVIANRLKINMALQIDATVIYALGPPKEVVLYRDLEINSPYNTYKINGLPLGPIASPGQAAIEAALNPQKHDYLYYVAKGDGSHHFTRTYPEHLQAKAKYIK